MSNKKQTWQDLIKQLMDWPSTTALTVAFVVLLPLAFITSGNISFVCSILGMIVTFLLFRRALRNHLEKRPHLKKPWWL
jgi:hypothetical protein